MRATRPPGRVVRSPAPPPPKTLSITVAPGRAVRDPKPPNKLYLEGESATVADNNFWRRRVRDGDVTTGTPKASTPHRAAHEKEA
jgi:Protein of unknown function (DUF2635)